MQTLRIDSVTSLSKIAYFIQIGRIKITVNFSTSYIGMDFSVALFWLYWSSKLTVSPLSTTVIKSSDFSAISN